MLSACVDEDDDLCFTKKLIFFNKKKTLLGVQYWKRWVWKSMNLKKIEQHWLQSIWSIGESNTPSWNENLARRTWPRPWTLFGLDMFVTSIVRFVWSVSFLLVRWDFILQRSSAFVIEKFFIRNQMSWLRNVTSNGGCQIFVSSHSTVCYNMVNVRRINVRNI